jgi:hypothetical protein
MSTFLQKEDRKVEGEGSYIYFPLKRKCKSRSRGHLLLLTYEINNQKSK